MATAPERIFWRHGFTLIELLIVVAIIAILAAIAVPNFMEAQVRAKIARAKTDMRSIGTALEAYSVDNNGYFLNSKKLHTNLTTPIAYMTSIPTDPFGWDRYAGQIEPFDIAYECAVAVSGRSNVTGYQTGNCWMLESTGPDKHDGTDGDLSTGAFPWSHLRDADEGMVLRTVYDATNGVKSWGEIFRAGGRVPGPSAAHATWFQVVSR